MLDEADTLLSEKSLPVVRRWTIPASLLLATALTTWGSRWLRPSKPDAKFRQTWLAQLAGPKMLNTPGFKPSGIASYYGGTNYAVGGAGTEVTSAMTFDRNRQQSLTDQVSRWYLDPAFNTDGVKPDALHVIGIGANDPIIASIAPEQIETQWADLDKVGVAVAKSVAGQIRALAGTASVSRPRRSKWRRIPPLPRRRRRRRVSLCVCGSARQWLFCEKRWPDPQVRWGGLSLLG